MDDESLIEYEKELDSLQLSFVGYRKNNNALKENNSALEGENNTLRGEIGALKEKVKQYEDLLKRTLNIMKQINVVDETILSPSPTTRSTDKLFRDEEEESA
jgi:predicted RNase H-like nuclease (RuvC/YqgF family)